MQRSNSRAGSSRFLRIATVLAALVAASASSALASTTISPGPIVNQHWTLAGSPYLIGGDVTVSLLTIDPGVQVIFQGNYTFEIVTTMNAQGTEALPIVFTPVDPLVGWKGMLFQSTPPGTVLKYCVIEYANTSALRIVDSTPVVDHCTVANSTGDASCAGVDAAMNIGSDLVLTACTIRGNHTTAAYPVPGEGGGVRAHMTSGTLRLEGCVIEENVAEGYYLAGGGGVFAEGACAITRCKIRRNRCVSNNTTFAICDAAGGGVFSTGGACVIANSTIGQNALETDQVTLGDSYAFGAGLYAETGDATLVNTVLADNTLSAFHRFGGGAHFADGTNSATNCVFASNAVDGVEVVAGSTSIRNSILFFNDNGAVQIVGTPTVEYSDVQGGYAGTGNLHFNPGFCGGCEAIELGSPCIDAGDPSAAYDDVAFPPSLGTSHNDMGAYGGPGGADWDPPDHLVLEINDADLDPGDHATLSTEGGLPGGGSIDALFVVTHIGATPTFVVLAAGSFCPSGDWVLEGDYLGGGGGVTVGFRVVGFEWDGSLGISNEVIATFE